MQRRNLALCIASLAVNVNRWTILKNSIFFWRPSADLNAVQCRAWTGAYVRPAWRIRISFGSFYPPYKFKEMRFFAYFFGMKLSLPIWMMCSFKEVKPTRLHHCRVENIENVESAWKKVHCRTKSHQSSVDTNVLGNLAWGLPANITVIIHTICACYTRLRTSFGKGRFQLLTTTLTWSQRRRAECTRGKGRIFPALLMSVDL